MAKGNMYIIYMYIYHTVLSHVAIGGLLAVLSMLSLSMCICK